MLLSAEQWLADRSLRPPEPISKPTDATRAWFAEIDGAAVFAKIYPTTLAKTWAAVEKQVAGSELHPSIVPLVQTIDVLDGELFLYPRVAGENLSESEMRSRFIALSIARRSAAVISIVEALAAICGLGYSVIDWYEGNMIYDFDRHQIWLFDWELCRPSASFVLEMDSNYGASRLMAPEEFVKGSVIDERTLVFNLGRFALLYLPDQADTLAPILSKATYPSKAGRYESVRSFLDELRPSLSGK